MTAQEKDVKFWEWYQRVLDEEGNPFRIYPEKSWAIVNGKKGFSEANLSISFLATKGLLETHICTMEANDLWISNKIIQNIKFYEQKFGKKLLVYNGIKGKFTRKIEFCLSFNKNSFSFEQMNKLIVENIKIVKLFIKTFNIDHYGNINL